MKRPWFGDEFGPFLIKTDKNGKVLQLFETMVDGKPVRSPDHPATVMPAVPGPVKFDVRRSKGFEGMAASPDSKFLYPLLEGPLLTADGSPRPRKARLICASWSSTSTRAPIPARAGSMPWRRRPTRSATST